MRFETGTRNAAKRDINCPNRTNVTSDKSTLRSSNKTSKRESAVEDGWYTNHVNVERPV